MRRWCDFSRRNATARCRTGIDPPSLAPYPSSMRMPTKEVPLMARACSGLALSLLALLLGAVPVHATVTERGSCTAMDKLGRGLAGMTTGFLELPGNIA